MDTANKELGHFFNRIHTSIKLQNDIQSAARDINLFIDNLLNTDLNPFHNL